MLKNVQEKREEMYEIVDCVGFIKKGESGGGGA